MIEVMDTKVQKKQEIDLGKNIVEETERVLEDIPSKSFCEYFIEKYSTLLEKTNQLKTGAIKGIKCLWSYSDAYVIMGASVGIMVGTIYGISALDKSITNQLIQEQEIVRRELNDTRIIEGENIVDVERRLFAYEPIGQRDPLMHYDILTFENGTRVIVPGQNPNLRKGRKITCLEYTVDPNGDGKIDPEEFIRLGPSVRSRAITKEDIKADGIVPYNRQGSTIIG